MGSILQITILALQFLTGAAIFSFSSVLIDRIPSGETIAGHSHCISCEHALSMKDMFPIFSFLRLRGHCRYCHKQIPVHCLISEIVGGTAMLLTIHLHGHNYSNPFGITFSTLCYFMLFTVLWIISNIDNQTQEIPDRLWIIIMGLGIIYNIIEKENTILNMLLASLIISLPMLIIAYITNGFGGGDIKLMFGVGFFLGVTNTIMAFIFAMLIGGIYGAYILIKHQGTQKKIAFGPYLSLGIVLSTICGSSIATWYLNQLHL